MQAPPRCSRAPGASDRQCPYRRAGACRGRYRSDPTDRASSPLALPTRTAAPGPRGGRAAPDGPGRRTSATRQRASGRVKSELVSGSLFGCFANPRLKPRLGPAAEAADRDVSSLTSAEPRVYPRTCGDAFRDTSGQPSTSISPAAALARNAGPAPYRWNTPPSATPPTSAANPVIPWYAPNPLPWWVPASRATSARSGLSVSPETRPSARNSPHAAAAVPARAIPTASIAYTSHPIHIVCPGPSRSLAAPPRKLDDDRTTCIAAHNSGTSVTGTPNS